MTSAAEQQRQALDEAQSRAAALLSELAGTRREIETHSANWHVIPDNAVVRSVLGKVRRGNIVEFEGELVDVEGPNGHMSTSLVRTDTGAGACEVLLATSARIVETKF